MEILHVSSTVAPVFQRYNKIPLQAGKLHMLSVKKIANHPSHVF
jgi:hypothetical protein